MEITITIPEELASRARSSGLAPDTYVERLLARIAAISAAQTNARDQLKDELLADWEHCQSTGLHLDEAEVDAWLAGLEQGHETDLPDCMLSAWPESSGRAAVDS